MSVYRGKLNFCIITKLYSWHRIEINLIKILLLINKQIFHQLETCFVSRIFLSYKKSVGFLYLFMPLKILLSRAKVNKMLLKHIWLKMTVTKKIPFIITRMFKKIFLCIYHYDANFLTLGFKGQTKLNLFQTFRTSLIIWMMSAFTNPREW